MGFEEKWWRQDCTSNCSWHQVRLKRAQEKKSILIVVVAPVAVCEMCWGAWGGGERVCAALQSDAETKWWHNVFSLSELGVHLDDMEGDGCKEDTFRDPPWNEPRGAPECPSGFCWWCCGASPEMRDWKTEPECSRVLVSLWWYQLADNVKHGGGMGFNYGNWRK